ncbi:MAG: ribokinase [Bacillota bacterium]
MNKIFVVGSLNMDLVFTVERIPNQGETLNSKNFIMEPGGKGANQALTCSILQADVYFIGCVGNDIFGERIINDLTKRNIDTENIHIIKKETTGIAGIIINNGDNRIITNPGANNHVDYKLVKNVLAKNANKKDVFLTQLEIPIETVSKSLAYAKAKKLITILNPAPARKLPEDIYKDIDIIIPNEIEAEMISGISREEDNFNQKAIEYFINKGVKEVIITKGDKGSIYGNGKELIKFKAYKVNVVDTTGAGDTFVATIANEISKGKEVVDSIKKASAASAIAVSKLGAQKSIPTIAEIDKFLKERDDDNNESNH